jgi:uncharacterized protein (TIGR02186 family)
MRRLFLIVALALWPSLAGAERVIAVMGIERIAITSNFTGTEIVVFGAIEPDAQTVSRRGGYDVVVTLRGPARTLVVRERQQMMGLWLNGNERTFLAAPTYYAALVSRPLVEIANEQLLTQHEIGIANLRLDVRPGGPVDPAGDVNLRAELRRLKMKEGLWIDQIGAVDMPTPQVFRARAPIPSNTPIGIYAVEVLVFSDGSLVGRERTTFEIEKAGFEQIVAQASQRQAWSYGALSVALAILTGWLAGALFRRS